MRHQSTVRHHAPVHIGVPVQRDGVVDWEQPEPVSRITERQQIDQLSLHRIEQATDRHEDPIGVRQPRGKPREGADADNDVLRAADQHEIIHRSQRIEERCVAEACPEPIRVGVRCGLSHEHRLEAGPVGQLGVELNRREGIVPIGAIGDVARPDRTDQVLAAEAVMR
jgi:hypothetical protein